MTVTETGQHRLKCLLPAGTAVAHGTRTSGTENGITNAANDPGLITLPDGRRLAVAVFITDSPEEEKNTREGVIARIAQAIWAEATKGLHLNQFLECIFLDGHKPMNVKPNCFAWC